MSSIRRRLTWGLLGTLSILILLGGFVLFLTLRKVLIHEFDLTQLAGAEALIALAEQELDGTIELDLPADSRSRFADHPEPEYFQFWFRDGSTLARSQSLGQADLTRRAGADGEPVMWDLELPDGRRGRALGIEFTPTLATQDEDDETSGDTLALPLRPARLTMVYARGRETLDRVLRTVAVSLAGLGLLLPVCIALVVRALVGRGLSPLKQISEEIRGVEPDSLTHRFTGDRAPEEMLPIITRLNELLGRLEEAFERERRFSSNVAHELRTPISELRTLSEVALRSPNSPGLAAEGTRNCFEDVLGIALQMERIVTTLLALGRAQRGDQSLHPEEIDLVALLERTWQPYSRMARQRGMSCRFELPDQAIVSSDPALLASVLTNLFSNAVIHAPPGGKFLCLLRPGPNHNVLTIANTNDTLRQDDLVHIFEPFWQKDPSRSSPDHSGLGLATSAAVAKLLAIEIRVTLADPNLLEVTLTIP